MSFTKKTWTDRISEYPTRRTLTKEDGTTETVTVTREEGTISQEGDAYSAANMNDLEQRVADGFSTLSQDSVKIATKNTTSDSIAFGIDSNGNYGYIKEGADTVTPFKSQKDIDNAYNSGVSAADARVNTSSASYNSGYANGYNSGSSGGYNSGYAKGKSDARLVLISQTNFANYETKTINIASGILIWNGASKKFDCFMKNGNSVSHLIDAYAIDTGNNGNPISLQSATATTVTFNGRYGTLSAYQIQ